MAWLFYLDMSIKPLNIVKLLNLNTASLFQSHDLAVENVKHATAGKLLMLASLRVKRGDNCEW